MLLNEMLARTREDLKRRSEAVPWGALAGLARKQPPPLIMSAALRGKKTALICEVKKASPSRGVIREEFDAAAIARCYITGGAAAISVLTEEQYFHGSLKHLMAVKQAAGGSLPVLRKDFIIDPYQVFEARAYGADAVLLIAAALPPAALKELLALSHELGMECLVEAHNGSEVETAVGSGAKIIGINNRDLRTFKVNLAVTGRLRPLIPADRLVVAESGIRTREDVLGMRALGVNAVLVGEALMAAPDIAAKMKEFCGQD